jgi:photosystem II stability/assembly factor-like uncharacterized protein
MLNNSKSRFLSGKKIILLFCIILFTRVLPAQPNPWSEQNSGVTATLTSVSCTGPSTAWVCGYLGTVLRTQNTGANWTNCTGNGIPTTVSLISISGNPSLSTNAIVTGYSGTDTWVWRTTNNGLNWTQVFYQATGFIDAVCLTSATNGFMMGDPVGGRWSLWKTTNGGANWDSTGLFLPQIGSEASWNNAMVCAPPNIWFGTNNTKIYYSTNNGTGWTVQATTGEVNSYAIWFHPLMLNGTGLMGGATLMQTSNYGSNWTALASMGSGNFGGITSTPLIVDALLYQPVWYVRTTNIIYYSTNFGVNWSAEYTNPTTSTQYRHISVALPGRGIWAVGTLGKISYHSQLYDIEKIGFTIPKNFALHQNYPNPFNVKSKIKYQIAKTQIKNQIVKLFVYDISGKEVAILVNQEQEPGIYEAEFDGSNLSSGVYFYRLITDGFNETKKMFLIK